MMSKNVRVLDEESSLHCNMVKSSLHLFSPSSFFSWSCFLSLPFFTKPLLFEKPLLFGLSDFCLQTVQEAL